MVLVITRSSQAAARYTPVGGVERCSQCRFFNPQGTCGRIIGPVSPRGWCKYYSREMAQRYNPGGFAQPGIGIPPGLTLDLNFMTGPPLDPRITFTRASIGTYFDATGVMQTAATDAARWDYDPVTHALNGLLIEVARTNVLLNSATLGTQSVAVTAQAYTLSFYGTGTITKSGTASGALVGTGAFPTRVSQTFTPTAGTLTLTVTGTVGNAQLEAGGFATSYIPTTAATAARAADSPIITPANTAGWFVGPGGSWAGDFVHMMPSFPSGRRIVGQILSAGATPLNITTSTTLNQYDGVSTVAAVGTVAAFTLMKGGSNWAVGSARACLNGGAVASSAALTNGYSSLGTSGLFFMSNVNVAADSLSGWIRRVRYWPRVLTDSELQQVTT